MRSAVFGLAAVLVSFSAQASPPNAAAILQQCGTATGAPTPVCNAYMNGVLAGVLVDQVSKEQGKPICLPKVAKTDDAILAVVTFIATHRELWAKDGNSVVGVALQRTYPCH